LGQPLTFSATNLPDGLSINAQTGFITGTVAHLASLPSTFDAIVTVTDGTSTHATSFSWHVFNDFLFANQIVLPHPSGSGVITLTAPGRLIASISPSAGVAAPSGVDFPFGFLDFSITGVEPGGTADLVISGLDPSAITDYYKYGATPANPAAHWYNFLFGEQTDGDSAIGTGMEIVDGNIVLHLVDGGRGDDDLTMNGVIFDIGGPATGTPAATVAGRHVFYNRSFFDGNNASANAADDGAIDPTKSALLPGGTASFANYTGYSRGINGVMIDLANRPAGTVSAADFEFKVGNNNSVASWTTLGTAPSVSVRAGAGSGGSDRVTLIWPDGTIAKKWLQVKVLATPNTGLAADDVFYFGNAVGEVGNASANAIVTSADESLIRLNFTTGFGTVGVASPYDIDKNRFVQTSDAALSRANQTTAFTALRLIVPPLEAGAAVEVALASLAGDGTAGMTGQLSRRRRL
jgi:hypothetical protein